MSSHDIFPSLAGAKATWRQVEILSNNLANASTVGFKEQRVAFELEDRGDAPMASSYVRLVPGGVDLRDGSTRETGVPTHLAIRGQGFFLASAADGSPVLVRGGDLQLSADNTLVTASGEPIQGEGGPIEIPQGFTFDVARDGTVLLRRLDGVDIGLPPVDRIRVVNAEAVEPAGGNRFRPLGVISDVASPSVLQGALEQSNTDPLRNMVSLLEASHTFELAQRAMRTSDELDGEIFRLPRS